MDKTNRVWNDNFRKYAEFIASHKNYKDLFIERGQDGNLKWVVAGKSEHGQLRRKWWDSKCREYGIPIKPGCYALIASIIHPTKMHTCQICGKSLSVEYVYPNKRLLNQINKSFNKKYLSYTLDIKSIIDELVISDDSLKKFLQIFKIQNSIANPSKDKLTNLIRNIHTKYRIKSFLSPGVMSNSPDRFDGFHSDGNCCRSESDKGRHKINLSRYNQDRRAYVNWADGDWKQADRLMSLYSRHNLSADHIGPISLGFSHRPRFQPMSREENSTKNNRMSFKDINTLVQDEKKGDTVISWHSKYLWDSLKNLVKDDSDALKLSKIMRLNMHYILMIFSIIDRNGYSNFLRRYLHPEYSFYDYKFNDFDPKTGTYSSVLKISRTGKNQQNNVKRYERIAFAELKKYFDVNNRRVKKWENPEIDLMIENILSLLKKEDYKSADIKLNDIFKRLSLELALDW